MTDAKWAVGYFVAILGLAFGVIPFYVGHVQRDPYMTELAWMASLACVFVVVGFLIPAFDRQFTPRAWRIPVSQTLLHFLIWTFFAIFVGVTFATADSIPLIEALRGGAGLVVLDEARASFLKTREGWEVALGYISGAFTGAILPYSISVLFLSKAPLRYFAAGGFFFYAQSFLQKALFLQIVIPLAYLVVQRKIWGYLGLAVLLLGTVGVLYLNTVISRGTDQLPFAVQSKVSASASDHIQIPNMFDRSYRPKSTPEHLVWRALVVPILTARDALAVHDERFQGRLLMGATSTFTAWVLRLERINYDAAVHGYQFGEEKIGRSNSVYITEGFVNFGWIGVAVFSLIVGQCFRWFWKSENMAFKAMWPLFLYNIMQASLIGSMLSSGFAAVFIIGLFLRESPRIVSQR